MNFWVTIGIGMLLHWLDLLFTVLLIEGSRWKFLNPEEQEINFHRHFFKRFGTVPGVFYSGAISSSIIFVALTASKIYFPPSHYFLIGIMFVLAYYNCLLFVEGNKVDSKMQYTEEFKQELIKRILK